jgi:hypothetical protein
MSLLGRRLNAKLRIGEILGAIAHAALVAISVADHFK